MNASSPEAVGGFIRLAELATRTRVIDRDGAFDLAKLANGSALADPASLVGASVVVCVSSQRAAAAAMVELDGLARCFVLIPPDLSKSDLAAVIEDAGVEWIVSDVPEEFAYECRTRVARLDLNKLCTAPPTARPFDTDWIMLTSGTSGRPKMVAHSLAALTDAIPRRTDADARTVWATFYDIRRYGGLQIFLRAIVGGANMALSDPNELLPDQLVRFGATGVTSISGTPSHWRRVLMTGDRGAFQPLYVRLSGEIADQNVLDALHATFPKAKVGHAYASTEAGVAFAIDDGQEGFPASLVDSAVNGVEMRVVEDVLHIRSARTASCYVGPRAPALKDAEGFVDTGDLLERRGDRYMFAGRRGGIVNVGGAKVNPEQVESILNQHPAISMSLVYARRNPITGAVVAADIVLQAGLTGDVRLKQDIFEFCTAALERHKVPAVLRFVGHLPLSSGGKLLRDRARADA